MKKSERLWAPWRATYITNVNNQKKGCLFCRMSKSKRDKENFVFFRSTHSYAVLNIYPYNNGHVLVVPNRHIRRLKQLKENELLDLFSTLESVTNLLDQSLSPSGYNIGMNLGRVAGAGFPNHLHIHVVPRWNGDTNFMPIVANTKVVSQSLNTLYDILKHALQK